MEYKVQYEDYLSQANKRLHQLCEHYLPEKSEVCRAARYSLLNGGKRVRAILVLAACDLLQGDCSRAASLAGAIEMLHCYSLIHDDLPCMDNDDYRRGQPSCHKAFSEATALLAGDALLTAAFEVIADSDLPAAAVVRAEKILSRAAGSRGMVYGQELDLYYETVQADAEQLRGIHAHKTGALINAALQLGAAAAGASEKDCSVLREYAEGIGLVFQIVDDVLDVTSTEEELGKPIGSDAENGKTTFVTLYGVEGAMALAAQINEKACGVLQQKYGDRAAFLKTLAENLLERKN